MAVKQQPSAVQRYSLISGGGVGSGLVVFVGSLHLSANEKVVLQAVCAWIAVGVSAIAPYLYSGAINFSKYNSCQYLIWRAEKRLAKIPDDADHAELRAKGRANIIEMETMLQDFTTGTAKSIVKVS